MRIPLPYPRSFLMLLVLALGVHVLLWFYGQSSPEIRKTADSNEYLRAAANLLESHTVYCGRMDRELDPALFSKRPPLYPAFIAMLAPVSLDPSLIVWMQILLNILAACFVWQILEYLAAERTSRRVVVALYLFYPAQLIYTHLVMAEILLQVTLLSACFLLVKFLETEQWRYLAACNLLLGCAPWVKPIMVYFWIPNLIYLGWLAWRRRNKGLVLLGLLPMLFVASWSYRNYTHTGYFHFSSIKTSNMLHVNIRGIVRKTEGKPQANRFTRDLQERAANTGSFAEASRTVERAFFETMFSNWKTLPWAYARGTVLFFLDPGRFDLYQFLGLPHNVRGYEFLRGGVEQLGEKLRQFPPLVLIYLGVVGTLNLLLSAGFLCCLVKRCYPIELRLFVVILMGYVLLIVAPTGVSRFRLSVMPFLLLALPPLLELFLSLRRNWRSVDHES